MAKAYSYLETRISTGVDVVFKGSEVVVDAKLSSTDETFFNDMTACILNKIYMTSFTQKNN